MNDTKRHNKSGSELEISTFYIDGMLLGIDILQVQEINQHLEITTVPHTPDDVLGVINLRGEVVTVLDLRRILGMGESEITPQSRNFIIKAEEEHVGLLVDKVADVVIFKESEMEAPPANINNIDSRFFQGIYKMDGHLLAILTPQEILENSLELQS